MTLEKKTIKSSDFKDHKIRTAMIAENLEDRMIMEEDQQRVKAVAVTFFMTADNLVKMLSQMPKNSKIQRLSIDPVRNRQLIIIQSIDFSVVNEGEEVPVIKFGTDTDGKVTSTFKESADFFDTLKDL